MGSPLTGCGRASQAGRGSNRAFRTPALEKLPVAAPEVPAYELNNPGSGLGGGIDKSLLAIGEPRRIRDKAHRKFISSQACLVCGRQPSDAHHLRSAQPRALSRKVSDEFTVPLCRIHHREVHHGGDEAAFAPTAALRRGEGRPRTSATMPGSVGCRTPEPRSVNGAASRDVGPKIRGAAARWPPK
jgi:hypothetical protein